MQTSFVIDLGKKSTHLIVGAFFIKSYIDYLLHIYVYSDYVYT